MSRSTEPAADSPLSWDDTPQDLYDQAPCGYLSALPEGTLVNVNQTFLTWTGYQRADLVGRRRFAELLTGGGRIYHETHLAPLLRMQGRFQEVALDVRCADGRRLPTLVNAVLGYDADGAPRVIRMTLFDATDRRRYEAELLRARRAAEESERQVRVLQQVVADLAAEPTATGVAQAMVAALAAAFGAADGAVWLIDRAEGRLRLTAAVGGLTDAPDVPLDSDLVPAEVVRRAQVLAPDEPAQFPGLAEALRRRGRAGVLLLPLLSGDEVLGVLAGTFAESRSFSDGELRLARLLGLQAGQALDRARLYDEARRRETRAVFLAATTRGLDELHEVGARARLLVDRMVPQVASWAAVRLAGAEASVAEAGEPGPDPIVLPLTVRGRSMGTLAVRLPAEARPAAEAGFLAELADRAALALENARLYEQEREIARTLQRSLLAGEPPADARFAVETHYRAGAGGMEVGGDWYDAFLITTGKLAVVVGDVVGRGLHAASAMGQLRSAIRALAGAEAGPARLIERLDAFVQRLPSARMATVAYGELTLSTGELVFSCAGHMPPVLLAPGAGADLLWGGRSAPLGSRAGRAARTEQTVTLPAGARLLLYTDGLVERRDRPLDDGFAELAAAFADTGGAPLMGLTAALADALAGGRTDDDVCLLCLSYGTAPELARTIPADPHRIAGLRADLRSWLTAHPIDEETGYAVVLACSEAVANAIEHGYRGRPDGVVQVTARLDGGTVELTVCDHGNWRDPRPDPVRGRGLAMIRQTMDEVRVDHSSGTVVTMRRRTEAA